ncbi:phage tail protein [Saccharothrix australiensis]|uniref:Phage tail P2-like protein n=1 Tax=Saccharothrix australiensis TaxID=2072 RepID=A0A495W0W9_9PSEU|nr:phage tail protein [Saccharothrix australiensis]RKT55322.1 phage tail P2-like protein [Saccharothrix australiensis]
MSRAALPELPSTHPIGALLPGLYAADDLTQRFTAGLDAVLSAVLSTLDNLAAYLDPALAPEDFVAWLASWVAADLDPAWPEARRRAVVRRAVAAHHRRGTARGLVERLALALDVRAEVLDGPAARWSTTPDTALPGGPAEVVVVRVRPGRSGPVDRARVEALVASVCPVHLRCVVEVLPEEGT